MSKNFIYSVADGMAAQQRGDLSAARSIYLNILSHEPLNPDALHLLGILEAQTGLATRAEELIRKSLAARSDFAPAWGNLGLVVLQQGRTDEAISILQKAIDLDGNNPDFLNNVGNAYKTKSQHQMALSFYDRALQIAPMMVAAWNNKGSVLSELNKTDEAMACLERASTLDPWHADMLLNKGMLFKKINLFNAAITCLDSLLRVRPLHAQALNERGAAYALLNQFDQAYSDFEAACKAEAGNIAYIRNKAEAALQLQRYDEAILEYRRCVEKDPKNTVLLVALGNCHQTAGDFANAIILYDQALIQANEFTQAHFNRGVCFFKQDQFIEAEKSFRRALTLDPENPDTEYNLGCCLAKQGKLVEAIPHYETCLRLDPAHPKARFNKALDLLRLGDFENGWQEYEARWSSPETNLRKPSLPGSEWTGAESLTGKTIFVYAEQGAGDTIQFSRYVRLLENQGAYVIFGVNKKLFPLFEGFVKNGALISDPLEVSIDFHVPLLSLPRLLKTRLDNIPFERKYLQSNLDKVNHWSAVLGPKIKARVGLAWSGDPRHLNNKHRCIPLRLLANSLPPNFEYVSLQTELNETETSFADYMGLRHFGPSLVDFSDTAALCALVDAVVTIDTSVAHLGGAMGRPTHLMLPFFSDFRWLVDRVDTPWYPSVTLYRQSADCLWEPVITDVIEALNRL